MAKFETRDINGQTCAIVYRIEHAENNCGMYSCGDSHIIRTLSDVVRHPSPYNDSLLTRNGPKDEDGWFEVNSDYFFGFSTIAQLRNWIYDDELLFRLKLKGYKLKIFAVPVKDFALGHTQVMFVRENALACDAFDIPDYLGISEVSTEPVKIERIQIQIQILK